MRKCSIFQNQNRQEPLSKVTSYPDLIWSTFDQNWISYSENKNNILYKNSPYCSTWVWFLKLLLKSKIEDSALGPNMVSNAKLGLFHKLFFFFFLKGPVLHINISLLFV